MRTQWITSILMIAACVGVEHSAARETLRQSPQCLVTSVGGDVQGVDLGVLGEVPVQGRRPCLGCADDHEGREAHGRVNPGGPDRDRGSPPRPP